MTDGREEEDWLADDFDEIGRRERVKVLRMDVAKLSARSNRPEDEQWRWCSPARMDDGDGEQRK